MKFLIFVTLALASTLSVSCLQCYHCGILGLQFSPLSQCLSLNLTCMNADATCVTITQEDNNNQTLIALGCGTVDTCKNQTNLTSCSECYTDLCNGNSSVTTTTTATITTISTVQPEVMTATTTTTTQTTQLANNLTTTTIKPVETTTAKVSTVAPTKKRNGSSSVASSLVLVLVLAVVLQFKKNYN